MLTKKAKKKEKMNRREQKKTKEKLGFQHRTNLYLEEEEKEENKREQKRSWGSNVGQIFSWRKKKKKRTKENKRVVGVPT